MDLEEVYDKIYRYVFFKVKNTQVAEDITQEAFLRYISKKGVIHDYEMKYLYTIAGNLCIDEYRRLKPDPLPEEDTEAAGSSGTSSEIDRLEDRMMIREALDKLPPEDQEILLLRYVNEESVGTVAGIMKLSRFALHRRLKSAEERLKSYLEVNGS